MPNEADIITFGCRLNLYESEAIRKLAAQAGLGDLVVVNSCAVTAEAERQTRQAIRKARRERPGATIVVTGCAAQIDPAKYAAMPEVDFVLGNEAKMKAETYETIARGDGRKTIHARTEIMRRAVAPVVSSFSGGLTRGFVEAQNGCDHACTYCVIPQGRGPSRSVPLENIVAQTRALLAQGYPEIALTGVDITSYGGDLEGTPRLGRMMRALLDRVPELKRLRLSSIDPSEVDEDLWHLIENEPRLMPHAHLSLQSGDDMVLKRMKRRHRCADVRALIARARAARPDIVFGADLIAGFPTEDEEMFARTCAFVQETGLTWLHVFPYSARKGTPAARMPQVPKGVRKERAALLRGLGEKAAALHIESLIGKTMEVHVEQPRLARAPSFAEVKLLMPGKVGDVIPVRGVGREGLALVARKVEG